MVMEEVRRNWLANVKDSIGKRKLSFDSLGINKLNPDTNLSIISRLDDVIEQDIDYNDYIDEHGALTSDKIYEFQQILAERYTGTHNIIATHSDSGLSTTHTRLKPNGIELRIKAAYDTSRGKDDLTKNKSFATWLSGKNELGYIAIRDKGSFYVIMIEGIPLDELLKTTYDNKDYKADEVLESLIDFIGDYYFRDDHVIRVPKVKEGQALFSVGLYTEAMLQLASRLPESVRQQAIDEVHNAVNSITKRLREPEEVTYLAPDSKISNLILIPHDQKNVNADNIVMIDRGWKDSITQPIGPTDYEIYLGLPFFDIGSLYQTIVQSKYYADVRGKLDECVRNLISNGEWKTRSKTYKTSCHPDLIEATFNFGRLYPVINAEVHAGQLSQERSRILNSIIQTAASAH